jgi:hypothetical protein
MKNNEFGKAFLRLALEIDKHVEGYVDAYYGPEEINKEVESGGLRTPKQLKDDHLRLMENLPEENPQRRKYLAAQLDAMGFMIRKLSGEEFSYPEEVEGLFRITPELVPEEVFLETHRILDEYIPGKGSLVERTIQRSQELTIPSNQVPKVTELIIDKIRAETEKVLSLIPGEGFETSYVHDKPWGAYHYYQGDFQSKFEINLDRDQNPISFLFTVCHEAYPGHHTEMQYKEFYLYQKKNFLEESCIILFAPRSVVSEGIADTGMEIIYPEFEIYHWVANELMPTLQFPETQAIEYIQHHKARIKLSAAFSNAALLYYQEELSKEEAIDYLQKYLLIDEKKAKQYFRFIDDPFWKTYVFTYSAGYRLIKQATSGKEKLPLFKRLLTEQLLPEDIV